MTGRTQPYADGEAVPILGELKLEEVELIRALREIDQISRVGVLASAIQQLNEAMRDREIKKDKNKKKILENAIKVLSNAIGQS